MFRLTAPGCFRQFTLLGETIPVEVPDNIYHLYCLCDLLSMLLLTLCCPVEARSNYKCIECFQGAKPCVIIFKAITKIFCDIKNFVS